MWYELQESTHLFSLRVADCRFVVRPGSLKGDAMNKIKLIQGVWFMINHLGDSMRVAFCFEDDQTLWSQIELIARITNSETTLHREIHFPSCGIVPSKRDWKIVKSIQRDPTKPYDDILKGTNLSYITVKKRLSRMIEERALFTIPSIEPRALAGGMMADLLISFEKSESKQEAYEKILSYLNECFLSAELGDAEHMTFSILITGISQIREIVDWMERQGGIKSVHLDLIEERVELYDTFARQVEKKLEQA
jgi:DNA-binding Lrp family transcriptional regulator